MRLCLDTSAWFAYFNGSSEGAQVRKLLEHEDEVYTPAVVAAQVVEAARLRDENSKVFMEFLQSRSEFVPVTADIARLAGKINARRAHPAGDWTLTESLVLATARAKGATLVTRDPIFAGLPHVEILGAATRAA